MNPGYAYNGEIVYCYFKIYRKYIKRQKKNLYYVDKVGSALEMYVVNEGNYTKKWIWASYFNVSSISKVYT